MAWVNWCQKWEEKQDEREEMRLEQARIDAENKIKQAEIAEIDAKLKALKYYAIPEKGTNFDQLSLLPPVEKSKMLKKIGCEPIEVANDFSVCKEYIEK